MRASDTCDDDTTNTYRSTADNKAIHDCHADLDAPIDGNLQMKPEESGHTSRHLVSKALSYVQALTHNKNGLLASRTVQERLTDLARRDKGRHSRLISGMKTRYDTNKDEWRCQEAK
jgi:hypothetical protein